MLKHTRALIKQTLNDLDTFVTVFQFVTQLLYIIYLTFLLINPTNIWYLHLALLLVSVPLFVFDIFATREINRIKDGKPSFWRIFRKKKYKKELAEAVNSKTKVKKISFWISHSIKFFVNATAFYPIITEPDTIHPLSLMCTTVMVLLWVIQILVEIVKIIINQRFELFEEAIKADFELITDPVGTVRSKINKIVGKEDDALSKERVYLNELLEKNRDEKATKKAQAKAERSEKLSSWLDNHLSKISFKRKKEEVITEDKELATLNAPEEDNSEKETE